MWGCAGGPGWTATVTPPVRRWEIAVKISLKSARLLPSLAAGGVDRRLTRLITATVTTSAASWEIAVRTSTRPASLSTPAERGVNLWPLPLSSPDSSSPVTRDLASPLASVTHTALRWETAVQTIKKSVKLWQSRRPLSILAKDGARIKPSLCGDFQIGKVADYKEILKLFTWSFLSF